MLGEAAARFLGRGVQALELEDPPVTQDRQQDLVAAGGGALIFGLIFGWLRSVRLSAAMPDGRCV